MCVRPRIGVVPIARCPRDEDALRAAGRSPSGGARSVGTARSHRARRKRLPDAPDSPDMDGVGLRRTDAGGADIRPISSPGFRARPVCEATMPIITLPDGSTREFDAPVTALDVAASIGAGLARAAVACTIDGTVSDLSTVLDTDCALSLITARSRDGDPCPEALEIVRHSCAHVMAEAIQRIVPEVTTRLRPATRDRLLLRHGRPRRTAPSRRRRLRTPSRSPRWKAIIKEDRAFTRVMTCAVDEGMKKLRMTRAPNTRSTTPERAVEAGADELSWYVDRRPRASELGGPVPRPPRPLHRDASAPSRSHRSPPPTGTATRTPTDSPASTGPPSPPRRSSTPTSNNSKKPEGPRSPQRAGTQAPPLPHRRDGRAGPHPLDPQGRRSSANELQKFIGRGTQASRATTEVFTPHIGKLDLYKHHPGTSPTTQRLPVPAPRSTTTPSCNSRGRRRLLLLATLANKLA